MMGGWAGGRKRGRDRRRGDWTPEQSPAPRYAGAIPKTRAS